MAQDALRELLLSLADDELIIGHRHSEWTGWAPHIEEDIAFSSIAQDEIGHASLYYHLVSEIDGRSPDEIALGRKPGDYRCAHICERNNDDWAYTLARHYLYDTAERIRLTSLRSSSHAPLAGAVIKILREERYHELHADAWLKRAASGPIDGRHAITTSVTTALIDAMGLFEPIEGEDDALGQGWMPEPSSELARRWLDEVIGRLDEVGIPHEMTEETKTDLLPSSSGTLLEQDAPQSSRRAETEPEGGRRGVRTEEFEGLWDDLTRTYREEPSATW